jgi:formylglycine-generating enzyme required for sulfatase activity
MIAIAPSNPNDPPFYYMMENKVSNDLYAAFLADPEGQRILKKYQDPGGDQCFRGEWKLGAFAPGAAGKDVLGVGEGRERMPVFRVTVMEAHCFAEWLGGKLPQRRQWVKAAGLGESEGRVGPYVGDVKDIAVNLGKTGPWPVDQGDADISIHGCRQTAGNGKEWTRSMQDDDKEEIPLPNVTGARPVHICGQSYLAQTPLTFAALAKFNSKNCTENDPEITFRVVLEP